MELKPSHVRSSFAAAILLIVPYGIETHVGFYVMEAYEAFNRTLWN